MARPAGLEPATPALEVRCSIQLSYGRLEAKVLARALATDKVDESQEGNFFSISLKMGI